MFKVEYNDAELAQVDNLIELHQPPPKPEEKKIVPVFHGRLSLAELRQQLLDIRGLCPAKLLHRRGQDPEGGAEADRGTLTDITFRHEPNRAQGWRQR